MDHLIIGNSTEELRLRMLKQLESLLLKNNKLKKQGKFKKLKTEKCELQSIQNVCEGLVVVFLFMTLWGSVKEGQREKELL